MKISNARHSRAGEMMKISNARHSRGGEMMKISNARHSRAGEMIKISNARHSRGGGNPVDKNIFRAADQHRALVRYADYLFCWVPACAGMTVAELAEGL